MASIKHTQNCGGVFPKLKVAVAFLKYADIVVASIQLTCWNLGLIVYRGLHSAKLYVSLLDDLKK
jgi:hypothetical protein